MKKIVMTMRSTHLDSSRIETNYIKFFEKRGYYIVLIPIGTTNVIEYLEGCRLVVLTGGHDEIKDGNDRYFIEKQILQHAIKRDIPVLGICRGMQMINVYFGGSLEEVKKHTGLEGHPVMITDEEPLKSKKSSIETNSYHDQGVTTESLASDLRWFALAEDGVIEGLYHPRLKVFGVQWHPERGSPEDVNDEIFNLLERWQKKE